MFCFSLLRAPLVLVAPLDPLAKPERTYVYICASTSIFLRAAVVYMSETNICFLLLQGNNGRPGKPGDRGAPGPQVRLHPPQQGE